MSKLLIAFGLSFLMFGCNGRVNSQQEISSYRLQHDYDLACTAGKCPCASPLGPIVDGGTAVAYDTKSVACGQACSTHSITLTCTNGKFDHDITNLSFSCGVDACKACKAGNNEIPHGFTVVMYNNQNVNCGASCDDAKRALVCNDGALQSTPAVSTDADYKYATCAPSSCSCALPTSGALTLGGSLKFYKSKTGTCDSTCDAVGNTLVRACKNTGTSSAPVLGLDGDTSFQYLACTGPSQSSCDCVLPDAAKTVLHHGQSQALFAATTQVNCTSCSTGQIMAYCGTGVLYDKPLTDPAKVVLTPAQLTGHPNLSCNPTLTKDCAINGLCIANNAGATLYGKSTLVCGDDLSALTGNFSCTNKALSINGTTYDAASDPFATAWQTGAPTNTCVGCTTPWGATIANGAKVIAYKNSGTSSNSCGGGCKSIEFTCKVTSGVGRLSSGDTTIDAEIANPSTAKNYTKQCSNACSQEGGGAPPRTCLLPWQNSFVTPDTIIPMYNQKTAICGDSCQNHFRPGRCQLATGTFDAGLSYVYQSCTELPCGTLKVTKVVPAFLSASGGTITLTGAGFTGSSTVKVGTIACSGVAVTNGGTTLTCTAGAGTGLYQDILVKDGTQKAMLPRSFSYYTGTCTAGPGKKVFNYSGTTVQSFVVPAGCTKLNAQLWGAGGGGHYGWTQGFYQYGGGGGYSTGTFPVTAGSTISVAVGGGGSYATFGAAGGGGYSGLFSAATPSQASAIIMAGGGGGGADPGGCNASSTGGEGGGTTGGTRGTCSGKPGTQSAGGAGGPGAAAGAALKGGDGTSTYGGGAFGGGNGSTFYKIGTNTSQGGGSGGGGGYFGGGAGAEAVGLGGGGGGGSGYLAPSVTAGSTLNASASMPPKVSDPNYISGIGVGNGGGTGGNGLIVISW